MTCVQSEAQRDGHSRYTAIIVMGVCGSGKTTLATALAKALNMEFVEGDKLHSKENIEKMSSGHGLNDQDREPWLECIRRLMEERSSRSQGIQGGESKRECHGVVIACSALKKYYREILRGRVRLPRERANQAETSLPAEGDKSAASVITTYFVYVKGSKELIFQRLKEREGKEDHYMRSGMLESNLGDLESPEGEGDVVVVDAGESTESQVEKTKEKIIIESRLVAVP